MKKKKRKRTRSLVKVASSTFNLKLIQLKFKANETKQSQEVYSNNK